MASELAIIETQLKAVEPQLHRALSGLMPTPRLIQTVLTSCERTPKLLGCRPQTILNGAMTFAVLGLPVDGATGQGFLLPFGTTAQAVIGYKGFNTLGDRAGLTISGEAVREDDHEFAYALGDKPFVRHVPRLGSKAPIVAFWAVAASTRRPPIVKVLSIDDILAVKAKSPAVRGGADTPWNDAVGPAIGFIAMGEKTTKRRLARSTPLITEAPQFLNAARMDEAFDEQGKTGWIDPDRGVILDGEYAARPTYEPSGTPTAAQLTSPRPSSHEVAAEGSASGANASDAAPGAAIVSAAEYVARWETIIGKATSAAQIVKTWNADIPLHKQIAWTDEHPYGALKQSVNAAVNFLKEHA